MYNKIYKVIHADLVNSEFSSYTEQNVKQNSIMIEDQSHFVFISDCDAVVKITVDRLDLISIYLNLSMYIEYGNDTSAICVIDEDTALKEHKMEFERLIIEVI